MTRFARAKGSKASNERLPNEATPWHIMKEQVVNKSDKKQEDTLRVKSAKELLSEKETPFYYNSLGNVNNDWAEFEEVKSKIKEAINEPSTQKCKKMKIHLKQPKDELKNNVTDCSGTHTINATTDTADSKKADKVNTKKTNGTDLKKSRRDNQQKQLEKPVNKLSTSNEDDVKTDQEKLSKRQKRNMNRKLKKANHDSNKSFDVKGNDWSNSIKFGKNNSLLNHSDNIVNETQENPVNIEGNDSNNIPQNNTNFTRNNFKYNSNRFDNGRFTQNKGVKRKPPKIRDDKEHKRKKPDVGPTKIMINGSEVEIIMYDGFPVQKHDAERLRDLRQKMIMKGIPKSEIDAAMKLERRRAEKALSRLRKCVCFHCRKSGHNLSDCPELANEQVGTGICFKCGSTEHTHFECKVNKSSEYRYATCFICREKGLLKKQFPDNPKGVYPQGGACKICGDVTHLKKDCPDLIKEKEQSTLTVDKISNNTESLEEDMKINAKQEKGSESKKIVKF